MDFTVSLFRDYTFFTDTNEIIVQAIPRPHAVVEIRPGYYWTAPITTVRKTLKIGVGADCDIKTTDEKLRNESWLKDYSLQLYQQKPKILSTLNGPASKIRLLQSLAAEFRTTEDTGIIVYCSRIPYWSAGKQRFYEHGRNVVILTTTNPGAANKSYVITPIFSGPQTTDSFPILTRPLLGNLEMIKRMSKFLLLSQVVPYSLI
jgi:hypothetical protein